MSVIEVDGVFIAIGHKLETDIFKDKIAMDNEGYILVKAGTVQTNIEDIFASGDVSDKIYRQAVMTTGMICMVALDVARHLTPVIDKNFLENNRNPSHRTAHAEGIVAWRCFNIVTRIMQSVIH